MSSLLLCFFSFCSYFLRGVIVRDINHNGAVLNYNTDMMSPPKDYQPVQEGYKRPSITTISNAGKKVADRFVSLTSAVGHGLSGLVDTILDNFEENEDGVNSPEGNPLFPAIKAGTSSAGSSRKVNMASRESLYDYEDEDVSASSATMKKQISGDPLLGVENVSSRQKKSPVPGSSTASITSSSPENGNSSPPHQLNGMGKGYANLPNDASVDPLTKLGSPAQQKPKASSSLFSPNWFPSSSSSSSTAPSSSTKSKILDKDTEKGSRLSVGVNLSLLHSHSEDVSSKTGNDSGKTNEKVPAKKRNSKHQENAVGDRLLDLADELIRISHTSHGSNGNDVMTTRDSIEDGNDVLTATARRLQGLVDVLSGMTNIVDYDTKYGNRTLPQPPLKPMYISTSSSPSITTPAATAAVTLPSPRPPTPKVSVSNVVLPRPRPSVTTAERNQDNDML
jgi:hypothetical protein